MLKNWLSLAPLIPKEEVDTIERQVAELATGLGRDAV